MTLRHLVVHSFRIWQEICDASDTPIDATTYANSVYLIQIVNKRDYN